MTYAAVQRAFNSCTWGNKRQTAGDWLNVLEKGDDEAKKRLFGTIFLEASDSTIIRDLFSEEQIRSDLSLFTEPLSRSHLEKRRKVWGFLYLGERALIPELDWVITK